MPKEAKIIDAVKKRAEQRPPATAPISHWTACADMPFDFIHKDFVNESTAALNLNLTSVRGGVGIRTQINETKSGPHMVDQTRLWFTLPRGRSFFAEFKTGETIVTHFQNGSKVIGGQNLNFYSTLSLSRQLQNLRLKVGVNHNTEHAHTDLRFKLGDREKGSLLSAHSHYHTGKWTLGYLAALDVCNMVLTQNRVMACYKVDSTKQLFLRVQNEHVRKNNPKSIQQLFNFFTLNAVNNYDQKTKLGFEVQLEARKSLFKWAAFCVEQQVKEDITTKFRVSGNTKRLECNAQVTLPLGKKEDGSFTVGFHGINLHKQDREARWGSQFEFNI